MRNHVTQCLLLVSIVALSGCSETSPPEGFEAIEPHHSDTSKTGCPELSGSFPLAKAFAQNPLVADWLGYQSPAMTTLIIDEWVGSSAINYRVQMDMEDFVAQAEQLRTHSPADYYDWRKLVLEAQKDKTNFATSESVQAIQSLGPLLQLRGQIRNRGCSAGWMLVLEKERTVQGEEGRFTRQWDLWVGRDSDGNLLLKTAVFRHQPGWTFWAAGGAGVRLIPEHHEWHKVPRTPQDVAAITLRPQDLPPVAPPNRSPDCRRDVADMVAYNQELMARLPQGVTLTQFVPIPGAPTEACNQQVLRVGFTSGPRGSSQEFLQVIQADGRVSDLVTKETRFANQQWHRVVEYRLTLPQRK